MFKLGGMASTGLKFLNNNKGIIRLVSVDHFTGKGGFLKCKTYGNCKKL